MPYSALFAQSKSYFTHKVRGCQTFLQRIDKLFYINISPAFPLSSVPHLFFRSAYVTCRKARHSTAPRFYPCASPRPNLFFTKGSLPAEYSRQFQRHSGSYFFGFASAFSDRTVQLSAWIIGIRRDAQDIPSFPPKREKRDRRPPLSSYSPHICLPRARPPCASFGLTAPCKHPHREPSAYLPQSLLPPYRTPILSQTYKNRSSAIKLNGEKQ